MTRDYGETTVKQKKSDSNLLAALLKLFLDSSFTLDEQIPTYRNDVLALGVQAEANVLALLGDRGIHLKRHNYGAEADARAPSNRRAERQNPVLSQSSLVWRDR